MEALQSPTNALMLLRHCTTIQRLRSRGVGLKVVGSDSHQAYDKGVPYHLISLSLL